MKNILLKHYGELGVVQTKQFAVGLTESITQKTLDLMLEQAQKDAPAVRDLAIKIVGPCGSRKNICEARKIQEFVQNNIKYVRDPLGVELLNSALITLNIKAGDCDDHSVLVVALLRSIGISAGFCAIANIQDIYYHVYPVFKYKDRIYACETTEKFGIDQQVSSNYKLYKF